MVNCDFISFEKLSSHKIEFNLLADEPHLTLHMTVVIAYTSYLHSQYSDVLTARDIYMLCLKPKIKCDYFQNNLQLTQFKYSELDV
jgi:hypothetical protein